MTELYETSLTKEQKLKKIYEVINFPNDDGDSFYRPVMYGDACDWIEKNIHWLITDELPAKWYFKRLPIDSQDDECIQYLYSLISK